MKEFIYENNHFYIQKEESEIPWLKIFTKEAYKELSELPSSIKEEIFKIYFIIEEEMLRYYKPKKINMASFANMLPRVHIHVMARFEEDSYYPNPMWGEKLREGKLYLPNEDIFFKQLLIRLNKEV